MQPLIFQIASDAAATALVVESSNFLEASCNTRLFYFRELRVTLIVSSSEDTEVEERRRQQRRRRRAATLFRMANMIQQACQSTPISSPPKSPPTSLLWVVSSSPTSPVEPPVKPVLPIRISMDEEEFGTGTHRSVVAVGANTEVATTDPTLHLKVQLTEVNLLKEQVFIDDAKFPICMDWYDEDAGECLYRCSACNTDYHSMCLLSWMANAETCPKCRSVKDVDCMFAKIKIVMPCMSIQNMMDHILNNTILEYLSKLNNTIVAKLIYHDAGGEMNFSPVKFLFQMQSCKKSTR